MSWQAVAYAVSTLDGADLTVADRLVFVLIAEHANRSGEAWPSAARVARQAGLHPSSVRRCVDRLVDAGLIATEPRPGTSTRYRFPVTSPVELSTPRAPQRAVDDVDPAHPSAYPAHPGAGVRAPVRDEPVSNRSMNQRRLSREQIRTIVDDARRSG